MKLENEYQGEPIKIYREGEPPILSILPCYGLDIKGAGYASQSHINFLINLESDVLWKNIPFALVSTQKLRSRNLVIEYQRASYWGIVNIIDCNTFSYFDNPDHFYYCDPEVVQDVKKTFYHYFVSCQFINVTDNVPFLIVDKFLNYRPRIDFWSL
jgi:hypothetical protein